MVAVVVHLWKAIFIFAFWRVSPAVGRLICVRRRAEVNRARRGAKKGEQTDLGHSNRYNASGRRKHTVVISSMALLYWLAQRKVRSRRKSLSFEDFAATQYVTAGSMAWCAIERTALRHHIASTTTFARKSAPHTFRRREGKRWTGVHVPITKRYAVRAPQPKPLNT